MNGENVEEFRIPAVPGSEKVARRRVGEFSAGAGFDSERIEEIRTAVSEAVLNAVEHGLSGNASETVLVRFLREANAIRISVSNKGRPFALPKGKPDIKDKIEGIERPRGWGLYLIQALADEVSIAHEHGVTTIAMTFSRRSRSN